jgi:hypothetical protein
MVRIDRFAGGGKNSTKVRGFKPLTFVKSSPLPAQECWAWTIFPAGRGRGGAVKGDIVKVPTGEPFRAVAAALQRRKYCRISIRMEYQT